MLAKNKSGWKLMEYIDIKEEDIECYKNVTGGYAILKVLTSMLLTITVNFVSGNCFPYRPYIVLFIIFNLLFIPSTKPLL